jgi:hypothetical protein
MLGNFMKTNGYLHVTEDVSTSGQMVAAESIQDAMRGVYSRDPIAVMDAMIAEVPSDEPFRIMLVGVREVHVRFGCRETDQHQFVVLTQLLCQHAGMLSANKITIWPDWFNRIANILKGDYVANKAE